MLLENLLSLWDVGQKISIISQLNFDTEDMEYMMTAKVVNCTLEHKSLYCTLNTRKQFLVIQYGL